MTESSSPGRPAAAAVPAGLGLGCWQFGNMGWGPSDAAASISLIRGAWEDGIRHFDTAQGYGDGRSEEVRGEAIQPFADRAFVSSKAHPAAREKVARDRGADAAAPAPRLGGPVLQIRQNIAAAAERNPPGVTDEFTRLSSEAMRHIPDEGNIFLFHP